MSTDKPATNSPDPKRRSRYEMNGDVKFRLAGAALALGGFLLVLATVAAATASMPAGLLTAAIVLIMSSVVAAAVWLFRLPAVFTCDEVGYRVRLVRGVGSSRARWTEVSDVTTGKTVGSDAVMIRLKDGTSTTIPMGFLAVDKDVFVAELKAHLNAGLGYRKL